MIRLSKSCIGDAEKLAVKSVLDREYLGMGVEVQKFEEALTIFFDRPAICVVNGTAALHLSIQACGVGLGDEVLVPSLTYISSFQAISATGAKPVACDINSNNLLLDFSDAENRITEKTKAIMPVHYAGGVGDLDKFYEFAKKHSLRIIEDAAHAFGTTYHDKRVGSFGDIACFSFDGIKNITSGEGGCVVTDDEDVLQKIRDARLLGVENDTELRFNDERSWDFNTTSQGWRYHMSNIMAAIGLEQLKRFNEFAGKRQQLAKQYDLIFSNHPKIQPLPLDYETVVPHIYVVRLNRIKDRQEVKEKMLEKGIQIGYHYQPNHWLKFYTNDKSKTLPVTDSVFSNLISLPLHPDLSEHDVEYVASEFIKVILQ